MTQSKKTKKRQALFTNICQVSIKGYRHIFQIVILITVVMSAHYSYAEYMLVHVGSTALILCNDYWDENYVKDAVKILKADKNELFIKNSEDDKIRVFLLKSRFVNGVIYFKDQELCKSTGKDLSGIIYEQCHGKSNCIADAVIKSK